VHTKEVLLGQRGKLDIGVEESQLAMKNLKVIVPLGHLEFRSVRIAVDRNRLCKLSAETSLAK